MSNNIVAFKKKYVLEDKQTELLKKLIKEILDDDKLLTSYILKPWLATEYWSNVFRNSLNAGINVAMSWLLQDLEETDKVNDPHMYDMYISLLTWYKAADSGDTFAFTLFNEEGKTIQYIFVHIGEGKMALAGLYDDEKDLITGIIGILNNMGMRSLGFQPDAKV